MILTLLLGHRVPWCCCATDWRLQLEGLVPLPDSTLQRRPPQDHSAWRYTLLNTGRCPSHATRHVHVAVPAQVVAAIRQQHCRVPVHMEFQLPVLAGRRHVQRGIYPDVEEVWRRFREARIARHRSTRIRIAIDHIWHDTLGRRQLDILPFGLRLRVPDQDGHIQALARG